jgi:hypothetical protein
MHNPNLVLQNQSGDRDSGAASSSWPKQSERVLTAQETDLLLTDSMWSRRNRRALVDNHSGDFRLFRIF